MMRVQATESRKRQWRVMRYLRAFSLVEVAVAAGAQATAVKQFVYCLRDAGIVKKIGGNRWQLVKDLGPCAPIGRQGNGMYDVNSGVVYGFMTSNKTNKTNKTNKGA